MTNVELSSCICKGLIFSALMLLSIIASVFYGVAKQLEPKGRLQACAAVGMAEVLASGEIIRHPKNHISAGFL